MRRKGQKRAEMVTKTVFDRKNRGGNAGRLIAFRAVFIPQLRDDIQRRVPCCVPLGQRAHRRFIVACRILSTSWRRMKPCDRTENIFARQGSLVAFGLSSSCSCATTVQRRSCAFQTKGSGRLGPAGPAENKDETTRTWGQASHPAGRGPDPAAQGPETEADQAEGRDDRRCLGDGGHGEGAGAGVPGVAADSSIAAEGKE